MALPNAGNLSPDPSSPPSLPDSGATFGPAYPSSKQSISSSDHPKTSVSSEKSGAGSTSAKSITMTGIVPEVSVNGTPLRPPRPAKGAPSIKGRGEDTAWGSIFWVTLVDPQVSWFLHFWWVVD